MVPRPAGAGQRRLQRAGGAAAARRARRRRAARAPWARSSAATRPCAPPSADGGGGPVQWIAPTAGAHPAGGRPLGAAGEPRDGEAARAGRRGGRAGRSTSARGPLAARRAAAPRRRGARRCCSRCTTSSSDGWSTGSCCASWRRSTPRSPRAAARLPELPVQYADYAVWQRALADRRGAGARSSAYWRAAAGRRPAAARAAHRPAAPAGRELRAAAGAGRPRPRPRRGARGARPARGATLFMVLLGGASRRCSAATPARTTCVVGTPGRQPRRRPEIEGLIGFFVNTLVLRTDLGGDPPSASCWRGCGRRRWTPTPTRTCRSSGWSRSCGPSATSAARRSSRSMLALQNAAAGELRLPGLTAGARRSSTPAPPSSTSPSSLEADAGRASGAASSTPPTFRRARPSARLPGTCARCSRSRGDAGRARLRAAAADRGRARASCSPAGTRTARRPARAADPRAVRGAGGARRRRPWRWSPAASALTYRELDAAANRAGPPPARAGRRARARVRGSASSARRRAGRRPARRPQGRRRLRAARPRLSRGAPGLHARGQRRRGAGHRGACSPGSAARRRGARAAAWTATPQAAAARPAAPPGRPATWPTSSTPPAPPAGPRASAVDAPRRRPPRARRGLPARPGDRAVPAARPAVASTPRPWRSGAPLLNGGRAGRRRRPATRSLAELAERCWRASGVTVLWLTAGLFHQLVDGRRATRAAAPAPRRRRRPRRADGPTARWRAGRRPRLINGYGPTEDTTVTSLPPGDGAGAAAPPCRSAGRSPAPRVYVLDARLRPVPLGVAGELYVGGAGLARGYLGRPELTAERFVPDPFAAERRARRLYRTGDLARWRPDGDAGVPGPASTTRSRSAASASSSGRSRRRSRAHPAVRRGGGRGPRGRRATRAGRLRGRRAPASCCPDGAARAASASACPATWCPSAFVVLAALPLTPTARSTAARCPRPTARSAGRRRPRGAAHAASRRCWPGSGPSVLGVDRVGADDDFFELGGHSLLATRVVSRGARRLRRRAAAVRALFDDPHRRRPRRACWPRHGADGRGRGRRVRRRAARARTAAALLRPGAALVPRPARPGERRLQHAGRPAPARPRSTRRRSPPPSTDRRAATSRCAPPSRAPTAGPSRSIAPAGARPCPWST